jgi:hypothetical protein
MFLRHIGKHGDRKVAVIFREVPGEPHMCLVTYPEVLNQHIHDPLMKCIESDIGQNSEDLAMALNRTYTKDGAIILQKLHAEGMLKKIRTELVVMTPQPNVQIKLDELNKILDEMKQGEDAVRKLAEMDASMGLQDPVDVARRQQAEKMDREAKGLMAEAQRLLKEAASLDPVKVVKETAPKAKKAKAKTKVNA